MTPEEFCEKMKEFAGDEFTGDYDTECAHINADDLMCDILEQLGYKDGVEVFKNMPRWYS